MREILFRGKRIIEPIKIEEYAPDGWVCGDLIDCSDEMYILPSDISGEMYINKPYRFRANDFDCSVMLAKVDTKSVGQFTGLTDKNGKKIFEGDILKIISSVQGEVIGYTRAFKSEKREDCAVVLWDYKTGGYKLKVYHKGKYKRIAKFATGHLFVYKAEVIGNIYDNPELLEVEQ